MHELSLAQGIVAAVLKAQKEQKAKEITEVKVILGELQQIEPDDFRKLLQGIGKEQAPSLTSTNFIIKLEPTLLLCKKCRKSWSPKIHRRHAHLHHEIHLLVECPACGSHDFEIKKGNEIYVEYLKGKKK